LPKLSFLFQHHMTKIVHHQTKQTLNIELFMLVFTLSSSVNEFVYLQANEENADDLSEH
jgi:hypothetical protein